MELLKDRLSRCFKLGYNGYKVGISAPALCVEWREQLEGLATGDESGSKEWLDGWYKAQREVSQAKSPELYR